MVSEIRNTIKINLILLLFIFLSFSFFLDRWEEKCDSKKKCENDGYLNDNCVCDCPSDTSGDFCEKKLEGPFLKYGK